MSKIKVKQLSKTQSTLSSFFKPNQIKSKTDEHANRNVQFEDASNCKLNVSITDSSNSLKNVNNSNKIIPLKQTNDKSSSKMCEKNSKIKHSNLDLSIFMSPSKKTKLCIEPEIVLEKDVIGKFHFNEFQDILSNGHEDFEDEFNNDLFNSVDIEEKLDLSEWQSCIIIESSLFDFQYVLKLQSTTNNTIGKCTVKDFWSNTTLENNSIVSIMAIKDENNHYFVSNQGGFIVLWPDLLISGTEIVNSLFCTRKSVLQDRFKGIDSGNKSMVVGNLVHELFQISITKKLNKSNDILIEYENLLKQSKFLYMLYDIGTTEAEMLCEIEKYIPQITSFVNTYVLCNEFKSNIVDKKEKKWEGIIENVIDIEENICSPKYGISGRIDVTVQVKIHNRHTSNKKIMPLELKTGRASNSAEHRGQVILYTMLMTEILGNSSDSKNDINEGLLLYLRDSLTFHEITANYKEKRDLILLRNKLAYYLEHWRTDLNNEVVLPNPINHHTACEHCSYLTLCSLYLSRDSNIKLSENHLLVKLKEEAIGHLLPEDIDYFLHWCRLLTIEDNEETESYKRRDIWKIPPDEREKNGKCLSNLVIESIISRDSYFEHTFVKYENAVLSSLFQIEDYVFISSCNKYFEASGTIVNINSNSISILINRDLTKRNSPKTKYILDRIESQYIIAYNLTNLSILMDNTEASNKLRRIIVDKTSPRFIEKIPKSSVEEIKNILTNLNQIQQCAILKSLTAEDYFLIRGMPGTGKTQTLIALIKVFVTLNLSVLVTSHTHSAVDNIFLRLKDIQANMLRLGSSTKIHKNLQFCSENALLKNCKTTDELKNVFNKIAVVGVTCMGSNHSLLAKRTFDVCIIDESTQVLQSSVIRPILAAKKFILVGDPDQLPPIVKSSKARVLGLEESLFFRLNKPESAISLTLQYRMNEAITKLANILTYENRLKCANERVSSATINIDSFLHQNDNALVKECLSSKIEDSVIFLDTGNTYDRCNEINLHKSNNANVMNKRVYNNICEAMIILNLIRTLLKASIKKHQIGVIAPYRDQISFLKTFINSNIHTYDIGQRNEFRDDSDIEINTVDQYQGRDKDIILYSCTRTNSKEYIEKDNKESHILEDKRRLTVAVTRAKIKLIIIGDVSSLQMYKPFKELFNINLYDNLIGKSLSLPKMMSSNNFSWESLF